MATLSSSLVDLIAGLERTWAPTSLKWWIEWPPDLFALTSTILKRTGAYRSAVSPAIDRRFPTEPDWQQTIEREADLWIDWVVGRRSRRPARLLQNVRRVEQAIRDGVTVEQLKQCVPGETGGLCEAILELHAIGDSACRGLGIPSAPRGGHAAYHGLANTLLTTKGSLSRIRKHRGVVLPKMRTPQSGLTLRSFSHHVAFQETEVDVLWRAIPWINIDENTINIMLYPWPNWVDARWFRPDRSAVGERHFTYRPTMPFPADRIVALVNQAGSQVNRIHVIAFPELAMSPADLEYLQRALATNARPDDVPMIVTGIHGEDNAGGNQVVLSTFFAGKWYNIHQYKHHRWRLNHTQLQQYSLGSILTTGHDWWEAFEVQQRQLTFIAANGWLTLCPLVCEDLAQLEPVSELIRGVGPTLVIALLLDGPQLQERWPGRYASVLADDPGSSVLTLTSLGMATRSVPPGKRPNRTIALWRDSLEGWHPIEVNDDAEAVILTVAADWREEFTADTRSDHRNAAIIRFQGRHQLKPDDKRPDLDPDHLHFAKHVDIGELTLAMYMIDAALDADHVTVNNLGAWALGKPLDGEANLLPRLRPKDTVLRQIQHFINQPPFTLPTPERAWADEDYRHAVARLMHFADEAGMPSQSDGEVTRLTRIIDRAEGRLAAVKRVLDRPGSGESAPTPATSLRTEVAASLAIVWAVHNRLSQRRRKRGLGNAEAGLLRRVEDFLERAYEPAKLVKRRVSQHS